MRSVAIPGRTERQRGGDSYQDEQQQEGRQDESGECVGDHRRRLLLRLPEQVLRDETRVRRGGAVAGSRRVTLRSSYLDLRFGNVQSLGLDGRRGLLVHKLQHHVGLQTTDTTHVSGRRSVSSDKGRRAPLTTFHRMGFSKVASPTMRYSEYVPEMESNSDLRSAVSNSNLYRFLLSGSATNTTSWPVL